MINLSGDDAAALQFNLASAGTVDVMASWVDFAAGAASAGYSKANLTSAATANVVAAPAASTIRNVKSFYCHNKGSSAIVVTILVSGTLTVQLRKVTLGAGDTLIYEEGGRNFEVVSEQAFYRAIGIADQSVPAALTAVTGGTIPAINLKPGTVLRWRVVMGKTAAGIAAQTFDVRFGTTGSTADTARISGFTTGTQTAAADVAEVFIACVIRSTGAAGVVHGKMNLAHNLASTGFAPTPNVVMQTVSAGFDMTVAGLKATLTTTPGASAVVTIYECETERLDP